MMNRQQKDSSGTRWNRGRRIGHFHPAVIVLVAVTVGTSLAILSAGPLGAVSVVQDLSSSGDFSSVEIRTEQLSDLSLIHI